MEAKELLRSMFPSETPETATKGPSGETIARAQEKAKRQEGDYLPVIAALVGVALVAVALLRKPSALPQLLPSQSQRDQWADEEESCEAGSQGAEQDYYR